jgi:hypothetical protein
MRDSISPVAPPAPPLLTEVELDSLTRPIIRDFYGGFCTYRLAEDRRSLKIKFRGNKIADPTTIYEWELEGTTGRGYQIPGWTDRNGNTAERFVTNSKLSSDFVLFPPQLEENKVAEKHRKNKYVTKSTGHGSSLTLPIRLQIGRQDSDQEHSGSGLIHIMFAHEKTDLLDVENLLKQIVGKGKIGAIYRTKETIHSFHRVIVLNRTTKTKPYRLVLEQRESYYRLITVFKPDGNAGTYSQFKDRSRYTQVYSWDPEKY